MSAPPRAPGRCRCCWWPCRGGCAARASAWPCAAPACPARAQGGAGAAVNTTNQLLAQRGEIATQPPPPVCRQCRGVRPGCQPQCQCGASGRPHTPTRQRHRWRLLAAPMVGSRARVGCCMRAGLQAAATSHLRVHAQADDAAGHEALVVIVTAHEGGMRAAVAHGHAEALGAAQGRTREGCGWARRGGWAGGRGGRGRARGGCLPDGQACHCQSAPMLERGAHWCVAPTPARLSAVPAHARSGNGHALAAAAAKPPTLPPALGSPAVAAACSPKHTALRAPTCCPPPHFPIAERAAANPLRPRLPARAPPHCSAHLPITMSAPHSPGGARRVRASRSVATHTFTPATCAFSTSACSARPPATSVRQRAPRGQRCCCLVHQRLLHHAEGPWQCLWHCCTAAPLPPNTPAQPCPALPWRCWRCSPPPPGTHTHTQPPAAPGRQAGAAPCSRGWCRRWWGTAPARRTRPCQTGSWSHPPPPPPGPGRWRASGRRRWSGGGTCC